MAILVVEDNRALASNIIEFLEAHGFECDYADNGKLGLKLAIENTFDVIILDIMLPGLDGLQVCQSLRNQGFFTPVLMLTARDSLEDKLKGFDVGTDDYLVKPFDLPELVVRLKVLAKRVTKNRDQSQLMIGDLVMDRESHQVWRGTQEIKLNNSCWKILEALLLNSPKVVTRQQMEALIWPDELPDSDVLKSHIYKLRQLVDKPFKQTLIETVRSVGIVIKETNEK